MNPRTTPEAIFHDKAEKRPVSTTDAFTASAAREMRPEVALVLGSGMGRVAGRLTGARSVPFADIVGLASTTIPGHRGCMTLGHWAGKRLLVFEGRLHFYEGHSWRDVVAPAKIAAFLGARVLVVTNAAGGIHDALGPGCLMALNDHIEWTRPNYWRQPGPGGLGPSRPSPYSARLLQLLGRSAQQRGIRLQQGVYGAVTGPCYETPAEIRALRTIGADAVGMSTACEVRAGFDSGLECAAVSLITNRAAGLSQGKIHHQEVLEQAAAATDRLVDLLEAFLAGL